MIIPPSSPPVPPVEPGWVRPPAVAPVKSTASGPPANPQAGQGYTDPVTRMEFVWVPPGCFTMGSPEAEKDRSANEVPSSRSVLPGLAG
ncbi:MAG: hypothetical protein MZV65_30545 [Chromatiales bacterium]|nr:hypothetical protein [Chromatiales bacterium]